MLRTSDKKMKGTVDEATCVRNRLREISGSHGDEYEYGILLGHRAV
jgi:hypothetical protein